ncbi:MAG TPA: cytochrome c [Candidatus Saccharimonadales bacterium]|nr:cytochrome c [Candidatus Saccharimonadales bacterium]
MMRLFALALAGCMLAVACAEPRATEPIARGAQVYREKSCATCHLIGTDGGTAGPPLTHIGSVAETRKPGTSGEDYIRQSILDPGAYVVPGYPDTMPRGLARGLSQEDFDDLVRYLLTLK